MNKIIITGRLTRAPELKACGTGTEVCNFCVAVDRFAKKGEEKQCDFIDCTAWSKTGVFVNAYFNKGDAITIEGRMESRKWQDKDGNNRISWFVTCENVEFPMGKRNADGGTLAEQTGFTEQTDTSGELPF